MEINDEDLARLMGEVFRKFLEAIGQHEVRAVIDRRKESAPTAPKAHDETRAESD
jgi:hypothetical protein